MISLIEQSDDSVSCCSTGSFESLRFHDCVLAEIDSHNSFEQSAIRTPDMVDCFATISPTSVVPHAISFPHISEAAAFKRQQKRKTFLRPFSRIPNAHPYHSRTYHQHHQTRQWSPKMRKPYSPVEHFTPQINSREDMKILSHFANDPVGEFEVENCDFPQYRDRSYSNTVFLGQHFKPGKWDVISGRGKASFDHIGNKRLRILVAMYLPKYILSEKRDEKTAVVNTIVQQIQQASHGSGGFVRKCATDRKGVFHWYSIGITAARERVGHVIRDCLSEPLRARSKTKLTSSRREEFLQQAQQEIVMSSLTLLSSSNKKQEPIEKTTSPTQMKSPSLGEYECSAPPHKKRRTTL